MSGLEALAVMVSILGVWLTARRSLWNFPFALTSVALYAYIFWQVKLYADMLLQGIFAVTLLYGLYRWLAGRDASGKVMVRRVQSSELLGAFLLAVLVTLTLGYWLSHHTDASLPWMDSALLAASVVGSAGGARRIVEHWIVWIVADSIYVGVYLYKALPLTALLYALFVGLAVYGQRRWQHAWRVQEGGHAAARPGDTAAGASLEAI